MSPILWNWVALRLAPFVLLAISGPYVNGNPVFTPEYVSIGAPLFPGDARGAATCYDYLYQLAEANCTIYDSETLPVKIHHCVTGDASGVLVMERVGDAPGTAVYRLRVVGPDGLWLLEPTYCRPDWALASYQLHSPGLFSVEVLMLYTSFSFLQPNASRALQEPWAGYLTLNVRLADSSSAESAAASALASAPGESAGVWLAQQRWSSAPDPAVVYHRELSLEDSIRRLSLSLRRQLRLLHSRRHQDAARATLPLCPDAGPLPGRWLFAEWPPATLITATTASALMRTCIWYTSAGSSTDCSGADRRLLRLDSFPAGLSWQPYGCRMRVFADIPPPPSPALSEKLPAAPSAPPRPPPAQGTRVTPAACLPAGRRLCFLGDSHTRYLHNSFVLWQRGFNGSVDNTVKELLSADNAYYETMRFGNDWPGHDGDGSTTAAVDTANLAVIWETLASNDCTDVVANFGQWPASYRAGSAPYSALQYLRELLRVRRALLGFRRSRPGVRVFWVTTCMSSLKARLESAGIDWRTDPLLSLYNRMAVDVMSGTLPAALLRMQPLPRAQAREQAEVEATATAAGTAGAAVSIDGSDSGSKATTGADDSNGGAVSQVLSWLQRAIPGRRAQRRRQLLTLVEELGLEAPAAAAAAGEAGEEEKEEGNAAGGDAAAAAGATASESTAQATVDAPVSWLPLPQPKPKQLMAASGSEGASEAPAAEVAGHAGNSAAAAAAPAAAVPEAIPVIDTWSATRILHDATWDGVHFTNTGAVGLVQLTALLHALCSEQRMAELAEAGYLAAEAAHSAGSAAEQSS